MDHKQLESLQESQKTQRVTIKAEQAAEYVGISYWLLLRLCKAKKIPFIQAGSRFLFRQESLDRWMANQEAINMLNESESEGYGKLRKVQ